MNDAEEPDDRPGSNTALAVIESATGMPVPVLIAAAGEGARLRFIDFFTAHIRNPNTRAAYGVAVREFFGWLELGGLTEVSAIRTHHVSIYVEMLTRKYSAPTVKQHLAAIRRVKRDDREASRRVNAETHLARVGSGSPQSEVVGLAAAFAAYSRLAIPQKVERAAHLADRADGDPGVERRRVEFFMSQ